MIRQNRTFLFSFSAIYFLIWITVSLGLNIHPDVLDHWGWSKKLAFGYANNPPMISYWMRLTHLIISDNIWAIRLGGIMSSLFTLLAAYWAARGFLSSQEAKFYLLILAATFYYSLLSQFWTIEQPYNFFWFLCLGSFARYMNNQKIRWLFGTSIFFALGMLSKYIIGLFAVIVLIWLLCNKKYRPLLWNPYLYLAGLVALIILFPHLYWNYQRDWVTFRFILNKGLDQEISWSNLGKIQLGHLFFYSIFFSLPAWRVFFSKKIVFFHSHQFFFLVLHTIIPIAFFSYSSFTGKIADPNWMVASYMSLFLLLAKYFSYLWKQRKKYFVVFCYACSYLAVFLLTVFNLCFTQYQFSFVSQPLATRINESNGWQETSTAIKKLFQEKNIALPSYIITKHYQTGGAIAFYLPEHTKYYVTQRDRRELVSKETIAQNKAIVIIRSYVPEDVEKIQKIFPQQWTYLGNVSAVFKKKNLRTFQIWLKT